MESGNVDLVQELMEWGQQAAYVWPIDLIRLGEVQPAMREILSGVHQPA